MGLTPWRGGTAGPDAGADDLLLVAAALADPHAFAFLYERYANQIHRFCYLRLGTREAAEDATSEVFLKAIANLRGFRGGAFAGWLFRIAQHVVADAGRRDRRSQPTVSLDAAGEVEDPDLAVEDIAVARSDLDTLRTALRFLPGDQRAVLELELADWPTEAIATALDRSPNAVRILRFRAYKRLRTLLNDHSATDAGMETRRGGYPC
jgi:RNA polymerase sigma-70 factor (ECF subfamily)